MWQGFRLNDRNPAKYKFSLRLKALCIQDDSHYDAIHTAALVICSSALHNAYLSPGLRTKMGK